MIGQLYITGWNGYGQLGDGNVSDQSSPIVIGPYTSTSAGFGHTVAIDDVGMIWAWGYNGYGQLGNNTTINRSSPVSIARSGSYVAVSAGSYHTVAIDSDGMVWTWGSNIDGQLGDGTSGFDINKSSPVSIVRLGPYVLINAGYSHTVAIDSNGMIWTWGRNDFGQLGDNTLTNKSSPVSIARPGSYIAISAGASHTVAIDSAGMIWAWGDNYSGQIGDGTVAIFPTDFKSSPVSIARPGSYVAVSAGGWHTVAIDSAGMIWAWGANVGDGTNVNKSSPVSIARSGSYVAISAGASHTVAIDSEGIVWAWGDNEYGQLGDNTIGVDYFKSSPVSIARVGPYFSVEAGGYHSVFLATTWTLVAPQLNSQISIQSLCVLNGKIYGGTLSGGRLFEWDGVNSWVQVAPYWDSQVIKSLCAFNGKIYGGTSRYMYGTGGGLLEWSVGGTSWADAAPQFNSQTDIKALCVFNNKIYGGTSPEGLLFEWDEINKVWVQVALQLDGQIILSLCVLDGKLYGGTSPGGRLFEWNESIWVQVAPQFDTLGSIQALCVLNGKIYGGAGGRLLEWSVGDTSWEEVAPQLNSQTDLMSLYVLNGEIYGGTSPNGLLFKWNNSNAWVVVCEQLDSQTDILSLCVLNDKVYGGTYGSGNLFEYTPPDTTIVADFSGTPTSGYIPLTVNFTDLTTGTPTTWSWNFGDGSTSASQNPSHIYTIPGTYTVSLIASNADSTGTETKTNYITVSNVSADFSGTPLLSYAPLTVTFTNSSLGSPTSWLWNFGDGNISYDQNPVHVYSTWGLFTVSLTAYKVSSSNTKIKTGYVSVPNPLSDDRYWIAAGNSTWNTPTNWAVYTGGPTVSRAPNSLSNVYFDTNGSGNCSIDTTVSINSLSITGYRDTISQNSNHIYVNSSMILRDGTFVGSGADMTVGSLTTTSDFTCTEGTMVVRGDLLNSGFFVHNSGTVLLQSLGSLLDTTASPISFYRLICEATVELDGTATIWNDLVLNSGALGRGRVNIYGDLTCGSSYNSWLSNNNAMLVMVGVSNQAIYNVGGGVLPSLWIEDGTDNKITLNGGSPLYIRGPFIMKLGNIDLNGLNIEIGSNNLTEHSAIIILE
jgi:PKD repeat protein/alpha-tubulin suppressor-like RCC1 family protein